MKRGLRLATTIRFTSLFHCSGKIKTEVQPSIRFSNYSETFDCQKLESGMLIPPQEFDYWNAYGETFQLTKDKILVLWTRLHNGEDHAPGRILGRVIKYGESDCALSNALQVLGPIGNGYHAANPNIVKVGNRVALYYMEKYLGGNFHEFQSQIKFFWLNWDENSSQLSFTYGGCVTCDLPEGYYVINNQRVEYFGGRILVPLSLISTRYPPGGSFPGNLVVHVYYSDDEGRTWRESNTPIKLPGDRPALEPGLIQLANGELLMNLRGRGDGMDTVYGSGVFLSRSNDNGETWSEPWKASLASPSSPSTLFVKKSDDTILIFWNDNPSHSHGPRRPLSYARSIDRGNSWQKLGELESGEGEWSYVSARDHIQGLILTYYQDGQLKLRVCREC